MPVDYLQLESLHHHHRGHERQGHLTQRGINESAQGGGGLRAAVESRRRSGFIGTGRRRGNRWQVSVRKYTNPRNSRAMRSERYQRRQESIIRDQAHDLEADFAVIDFPFDPISSCGLQQNLRLGDSTELES